MFKMFVTESKKNTVDGVHANEDSGTQSGMFSEHDPDITDVKIIREVVVASLR